MASFHKLAKFMAAYRSYGYLLPNAMFGDPPKDKA